jgi:hypothetical protein
MAWRPIVLFVGDDASSTQIAESLLRRLVGKRVEIHTAGAQPPNPGGREDQMLVMMGLNPAHEERLTAHALATSDRVIILGTSLDVARVPGRRYEEWELDVSSLEERVITLAAELTRPPSTQAAAAPTPEKQTRRQLIYAGSSASEHRPRGNTTSSPADSLPPDDATAVGHHRDRTFKSLPRESRGLYLAASCTRLRCVVQKPSALRSGSDSPASARA